MVPSISEPHFHRLERLETPSAKPSSRVLIRLYVSHFLSTWNSRMFEFGAVLFLASIFPGTLLYASIYALVRSLSAVILSSWLGTVVDQSNRLTALQQSIVWQRLPVAGSCVCFVTLLVSPSSILKILLFLTTVVLACAEKLAATVNTVAVERDWAIVVADALEIPRQDLNASMRRIDLFCKLVAPLFISLIDGFSTMAAIWTTLGINMSCVAVEYVAIAQVYASVPHLVRREPATETIGFQRDENDFRSVAQRFVQRIKNAALPWREYIQNRLFLASLALSLLYLTVLSFGATMVTYLLHTGFTPLQVSAMRIGAVAAELSGTWAAPFIMNRVGAIRAGLWFLNWQFSCLVTAVAAFAFLDNASQVVAVSLIVGVALSRIGLWGFDLSVQFLVQEGVNEESRARFSATEMALQNIFELLSFATTIAFPRPEQFKYPVYISYGAITMAAACFAAYVRKERGHLLHTSKCLGGDKKRLSPGDVLYHRVP
ncbi:putative iron-regulated transporter [Aspergillus saccharolyticus JOP 1030-1]|uniref:Solute carrier family 40 member n=1 Tax=Aspergillus saccharolyticus JOP 1030-1 TaxID=1450539 RepID=A0A318Z9A8_9EURO|nr:hypothetical protein BP01DRAFT_358229 [Aspergillus saccharolyticus JOP 1030-1]PYH43799.1 hypothetical protein BP01DRAFT_358229 [Aspergillus saccharolyticus JOP 1030-1]